jgi:WD40 repeat protein
VNCPSASSLKDLSSVLVIDISGSMSYSDGMTSRIQLAKSAAHAWVNTMPLGRSECAVTSFDGSNYLNQDFTTDRTALRKAISPLTPLGGTDYDAAFIKSMAGGLLVSKYGKYQKVIVFLTDGLGAGTESTIIDEANKQNCIIYCVTLGMPAPAILKNISAKTGGQTFENITSEKEAEIVYRKILQLSQGALPCEVEWMSDISCVVGDRTVDLTWQELHAQSLYTPPVSALASLVITPAYVSFGRRILSSQTDTIITLTAQNSDFTITGIRRTYGNADFTVLSPAFPLTIPKNTSTTLTLRFTPGDSAMKYASFEILTDLCPAYVSAGGGYPSIELATPTLKLTKPNGGERYVVGSDTTITWEGIAKSDTVELEYSIDNGSTWQPITTTASNGQYIWKNIPKPTSQECKVRVQQIVSTGDTTFGAPGTMQLDLSGHTDSVIAVRWSPDGTKVATASNDRTARIWSTITGASLLTLSGHNDVITSIDWHPDGSKIATSSNDKTVRIWSTLTGKLLHTLSGHAYAVHTVRWSPDGTMLATTSLDNTARIWSSATGANLSILQGHTDDVLALDWSPDGTKIVTAGEDNTIRIWSVTNGTNLQIVTGHTTYVTAVEWSPDGSKIASASIDKTAQIWSATTGTSLHTLSGHTDYVNAVHWSADGTKLVTASKDKTARIWSGINGSSIVTLYGHTGNIPNAAWSPDGSKIVTASADSTVRIWSATSGVNTILLSEHKHKVTDVQWSPDGTTIASASIDNTAALWSAISGANIFRLQGHTRSLSTVSWSPDGTKVCTSSGDTTVRIWSAENGVTLLTLRGHTNYLNSARWSPDGSKIASTSRDLTTRIYEATSGALLLTLAGAAKDVEWSPDGTKIATVNADSTVGIWSSTSGLLLQSIPVKTTTLQFIRWKPDGTQLATVSYDSTARIWSTTSGLLLLTLSGHTDYLSAIRWSPDGLYIATASYDKTARIWSSASGARICTLSRHTDRINDVDWSPDGVRIATSSSDRTARVWLAMSGVELFTLHGQTFDNRVIRWNPDGSKIATVSDRDVRIWSGINGTNIYTLQGHTSSIYDLAWSPNGTKIATASSDHSAKIWYISVPTTVLQKDESDSLFSIVAPEMMATNIDMKQCLVGALKDSVIIPFISNIGSYHCRVDSIFFTGTDAGSFELVSGFPRYTLADGTKKNTEFRFKPQRVGMHNATIHTITQSDTLLQTIIGEGVAPKLSVLNNIIDFGQVQVNTIKDSLQTMTIKNLGTTPLTITATRHIGPNDVDFSTRYGGGPFTLAAGDTARADLRFKAAHHGRTSGRLLFEFDGFGSPATVMLFGEGVINVNDTARTTVIAQDITAQAGEKVHLTLKLQKSSGMEIVGAPTDWYARIHYNRSILFNEQTGNVCAGTTDSCMLELSGVYDPKTDNLITIPCITTLGNIDHSTIVIDTFLWMNSGIITEVATQNGTITLTDVCEDGGVRLFIPAKNSTSLSTRPNPVQDNLQIHYGLREPLTVTLELLTMTGQVVQTILNTQAQAAGQYTLTSDLSVLGNGVYMLHMRTNKEMLTTRVDVVK